MLEFSALRADGTAVDGFAFERDGDALHVTYAGAEPVEAGIRVELELEPTDDPGWLIPGVFYGENRPAACTRIYPRFVRSSTDASAGGPSAVTCGGRC